MTTTCRRCRRRGTAEIRDGWLVEHRADGRDVWHRILPQDLVTRGIIDTLTDGIGLRPAPRAVLITTDDEHLGTFDLPDILVAGWQDVCDWADRLMKDNGPSLAYLHAEHWNQGATVQRTLTNFVRYWVMAQVFGHELGHMIDSQRPGLVPALLVNQASAAAAPKLRASVQREVRADYLNGGRWERLGWDPRLGALISRALGCTWGAACDHPTPHWREQAFWAGYNDELRAEEAEQREMREAAQAAFWQGFFAVTNAAQENEIAFLLRQQAALERRREGRRNLRRLAKALG